MADFLHKWFTDMRFILTGAILLASIAIISS
jgi:hypothetical protein